VQRILEKRDLLGEGEVDGIERNDEIFVVVNLLKSANNTRLASYTPSKVLMCYSIVQAHALLVDGGQMVLVCGGEIVAVESQVAGCTCQLG
jgi:hypothetical protein